MNDRLVMYELTDHLEEDIDMKNIKRSKTGKRMSRLKHLFIPRKNKIKKYRKESLKYDIILDKVEDIIDTTVYS